MPKIKRDPLVALAEKMAPALKAAEWRITPRLQLRASRRLTCVTSGRLLLPLTAARDEETRALADQLREGLQARTEAEHRAWRDELAQTIAEGRTVRSTSPEFAPRRRRALPCRSTWLRNSPWPHRRRSRVTSPPNGGRLWTPFAFSPARTCVTAEASGGAERRPQEGDAETRRPGAAAGGALWD